MTINSIKTVLERRTSALVFKYNNKTCGVDPINKSEYDIWYGENLITVDGINEAMSSNVFEGKSLKDIFDEIELLE